MKIICLLLCFLSLTTAKVIPRTGVNNVFDGVEGMIYDVPDYEDPAVSLFKLFAKGVMPVYTMRGIVKGSTHPEDKDDKPHYRTDDIKKGLDTVIAQLQEAKNKLENGNNRIYLDIDKSVLSLENLKHHLYLDLHAVDVTVKRFRKPDILPEVTSEKTSEETSEKTSMDKYSLAKSALKKYLSSDDSIFKYLSLDSHTVEPHSYDNSGVLSFDSDTSLAPLSTPNVYDEESSLDYHSGEQSSESIVSEDENLPSAQPLVFDIATEATSDLGKDVFKYQFLKPEVPSPVEATPDDKKMMTRIADDVVSSAEADKVDQGDKTYIRKKWSMKLSSTI